MTVETRQRKLWARRLITAAAAVTLLVFASHSVAQQQCSVLQVTVCPSRTLVTGFTMLNLPPPNGSEYVGVTYVSPQSPLDGTLKSHDAIIALNGIKTPTPESFMVESTKLRPGDIVKLDVLRLDQKASDGPRWASSAIEIRLPAVEASARVGSRNQIAGMKPQRQSVGNVYDKSSPTSRELRSPNRESTVAATGESPSGPTLPPEKDPGSSDMREPGDTTAAELTVEAKGECKLQLPDHAERITCISVSANGRWIAIGSETHVAVLLAATLEQVFSAPATNRDRFQSDGEVRAIAINDEGCLIWATFDGEITLIDVQSHKILCHIPVDHTRGSRPGVVTAFSYSNKKEKWFVANSHGIGTISQDGKIKKVVVKGVKGPGGEYGDPDRVALSPDGQSACWVWFSADDTAIYASGLDGELQGSIKDDSNLLQHLGGVSYRGEDAVLIGTGVGVLQCSSRQLESMARGAWPVVAPVGDSVLEAVAGCVESPLTFALSNGGTLYVLYGFAKDLPALENGCQNWSDRADTVDGYSRMAVSQDGSCLAASYGDNGLRVFSVSIK
jgi:WD40 repeat protein